MTEDRRRIASEPSPALTQAGFTLVELVVALSLLALVLVMFGNGLRFGTAAWETVLRSGQDVQSMQVARDVVRRVLASTIPTGQREREPFSIAFQGTPTEVRFVGLPPDQVAGGGPRNMAIRVQPGQDGQRLVLLWQPIDRSDAILSALSSSAERAVLIDGLEGLAFAFLGDDTWHSTWRDRTELPRLVRLEFDTGRAGTPWPPLDVALKGRGLR